MNVGIKRIISILYSLIVLIFFESYGNVNSWIVMVLMFFMDMVRFILLEGNDSFFEGIGVK